MGTLYQTDPILRLIQTDGIPAAFVAMDDDEQRWRGRYFLMSWWASHDVAYSWTIALAEPESEGKPFVATVDDEQILAAMRGYDAEMRETATT